MQANFRSPARALIRQSSACSSLSKLTDLPAASPCREGSIYGSGRAALTSVLASPGYVNTAPRKVTSLTVGKSSWTIPDARIGYVSFPSFVPSSSQCGSIATLFGRNESLIPLTPDANRAEKTHEVPVKPVIRRTWMNLAPRTKQNSVSTVRTRKE